MPCGIPALMGPAFPFPARWPSRAFPQKYALTPETARVATSARCVYRVATAHSGDIRTPVPPAGKQCDATGKATPASGVPGWKGRPGRGTFTHNPPPTGVRTQASSPMSQVSPVTNGSLNNGSEEEVKAALLRWGA